MMGRKQPNPPPPDISQRPPPPPPPPVRGVPLLSGVIKALEQLEEYRQAEIRGEERQRVFWEIANIFFKMPKGKE